MKKNKDGSEENTDEPLEKRPSPALDRVILQ